MAMVLKYQVILRYQLCCTLFNFFSLTFCKALFIIDDCSAEGEINKKQDALSELAFSGRHRNHYLWVLTQK